MWLSKRPGCSSLTTTNPHVFSSGYRLFSACVQHTHMEAHAVVYAQTKANIRFIQACTTDTQTHAYGVQPPTPLLWRGSNMPPHLSTRYLLAQKIHNQCTDVLQLHTHTHSQKHTQLLPFSKSTHSQMGHALELKSGAVKKTKQGERRV